MKTGIDLLKAKEKISEKELKLRRFLQIGSSLLLVFYILIVGALFSFKLVQERESRLVAEKISRTKAEINNLKKIESLQSALKERLKTLTSVFEKGEVDYEEIITLLENLSPTGISLSDINLNKEGEIDVMGTAENSQILDEFLNTLSESSEEFESIILSSLKSKEGEYEFSLKFLKGAG